MPNRRVSFADRDELLAISSPTEYWEPTSPSPLSPASLLSDGVCECECSSEPPSPYEFEFGPFSKPPTGLVCHVNRPVVLASGPFGRRFSRESSKDSIASDTQDVKTLHAARAA